MGKNESAATFIPFGRVSSQEWVSGGFWSHPPLPHPTPPTPKQVRTLWRTAPLLPIKASVVTVWFSRMGNYPLEVSKNACWEISLPIMCSQS